MTYRQLSQPPYPVTATENIGEARSYLSRIEVWRSFGGPDPFRDPPTAPPTDSAGVLAAKHYLLTPGRPNNSFSFQWWSKRPPGNASWNGGPGSLDEGDRTDPYTIYECIIGQKGTHSTTDTSYTDGWRNSEIKYELYDGTYKTFGLGKYLYKSPSNPYGSTEGYWDGTYAPYGWEPPAQTPPDYSAYQDPPNTLANLLRARLVIEYVHRGDANSIFVSGGGSLHSGTSGTTINLSREYIYSNINSWGDIRFDFEIGNRTFNAIPGVPTSTRSLTVDNTTAIYSHMELDFMSPSWDKFVYTAITPPLRLAQRDDQQGLSPTARLDMSPSSSYQKNNSSRIYGGLYL